MICPQCNHPEMTQLHGQRFYKCPSCGRCCNEQGGSTTIKETPYLDMLNANYRHKEVETHKNPVTGKLEKTVIDNVVLAERYVLRHLGYMMGELEPDECQRLARVLLVKIVERSRRTETQMEAIRAFAADLGDKPNRRNQQ